MGDAEGVEEREFLLAALQDGRRDEGGALHGQREADRVGQAFGMRQDGWMGQRAEDGQDVDRQPGLRIFAVLSVMGLNAALEKEENITPTPVASAFAGIKQRPGAAISVPEPRQGALPAYVFVQRGSPRCQHGEAASQLFILS